MLTISDAFKLKVGYSDHSQGIVVPIAAVSMNAGIIEKHFTLDRNMEGPDHKASLEPQELKEMIAAIRKVELALGDGIKGPQPSEVKNKEIARKSLVAETTILKGEKLTKNNLSVKRPGNGMSALHYWDVLGKSASRDYESGDLIDE